MHEFHPVRVVVWGLDAVGLAVARLVRRRPGYELAGAISREGDQVGRDLGELLGFGERLEINVNNDPMGVLTAARPDVTLISDPGAAVDELGPRILQAVEAGSNVVCLAESMVYPWASRPDLAESLDELAHAHGVTILGTGVAPGFVTDTLAVSLTGCCMDVERIRISRSVDLSMLGRQVLEGEYGIGLSPSHYNERNRRAPVTGLSESIHLIADALGWNLERVEEDTRPILAETRAEIAGIRVNPGQVSGRIDAAVGYVDGLAKIVLEHPQTAASARSMVVQTGDYIEVEGRPSLRLSIEPEIPTVDGNAALAVNMIPALLQVGPGLLTMADMPVPRAVLGDLRDLLDQPGPTVEDELARGWHLEGLGGHPAGDRAFPGESP